MDKENNVELDTYDTFVGIVLEALPNMSETNLVDLNLQSGYILQDRREEEEWKKKYENK